jgi:2-polyprenyl-6-methoxyphenol hydroxylase-like FAD-dependent oxidoreductase
MTLGSLPSYDATAVDTVGDHAVVVGASMAGLLAGRVLADGYDRVTILDRDPLPDEPVARRGVPQATHAHVMLEPARAMLETLFPGYLDDLTDAGGITIDTARELEYHHDGGFVADGLDSVPMYCASRPLFEQLTRRHASETANVTLRPETHVTGLVSDEGAERVTGVQYREDGSEATLSADLVVDARGRNSPVPAWLENHGYAKPETDTVSVDVGYATTRIERPPAETTTMLVGTSPPTTQGGAVIPIEDDQWMVTLSGLHGEYPPTDPDGFMTCAELLPVSHVADILAANDRVAEIHPFRFPSSTRRRYDQLDAFPDGLLVTGDALASFNPVYGQGMSVSALDALQLHAALAAGTEDLAARFFDRTADVIEPVWQLTVGSDFAHDATTGPKPPGTDLFNRYMDRLIPTAHDNDYVAEELKRVIRLQQDPTKLLAPGVLARVLAPNWLTAQGET